MHNAGQNTRTPVVLAGAYVDAWKTNKIPIVNKFYLCMYVRVHVYL